MPAPGTSSRSQQEDEGEEEEADGLGSLPSSSSSMAPPSSLPTLKAGRSRAQKKRQDFSPIPAEDCFEQALEVDLDGQGSWRVYYTPPHPPRSKQSTTTKSSSFSPVAHNTSSTKPNDPTLASLQLPDVASDEEDDDEISSSSPGTVFLFHHGAGFSALSFALAAKEIKKLTQGEAGVMAIDCRGHGRTRHPPEVSLPLDMSLEQLTNDYVSVLLKLYPPPTPMPTFVLVGHSMGGSVVVSLSTALQSLPRPAKVAGVAVLDVVEGTAMDALEGMKGIVLSHPKGFKSVEEAIRWHGDSGSIHNLDSARRSVCSLLVKNSKYRESDQSQGIDSTEPMEELQEEQDETEDQTFDDRASSSFPYIWRANLLATQPHWRGWFEGLSNRFLTARTARLLLLAGTDRLDKDLMVGQMQGKYQLTVFTDVGHCLQEVSVYRLKDP